MTREYVMLAKPYTNQDVSEWFVSEKFDGQRCIWDGGWSRGKSKKVVPYANVAKDERYVNEQVCTGLWSRYGNVIHAPDYFLDSLPVGVWLDGELWLDRGRFQSLRSIVSRLEPGPEWKDIRYLLIDEVPPCNFFVSGQINNPNCKIRFSGEKPFASQDTFSIFAASYPKLVNYENNHVQAIKQVQLPRQDWYPVLLDRLESVVAAGGEGLILRRPVSVWYPKRTPQLLKVKPFDIDSAIVVGYRFGEGKYEGLMGALVVEWNGHVFNLSGFTDEERVMSARLHPGAVAPANVFNPKFPRGSRVKFRYVTVTNAGVPREARYERDDEVQASEH